MSSFIGTPSGVGFGQWLTIDDTRLRATAFNDDIYRHVRKTEPFHHTGFMSPWWPGNGGLDASGGEWLPTVWHEQPEKNSGAVSRMAFIGISQDQYGSATGGCTMKLFKTADGGYTGTKDTKIDEVVSDSLGNFILYTPYYPDAHYITLVKDGSPSIQGMSVNTLIGA